MMAVMVFMLMVIMFHSVMLHMINNQPHSGLFGTQCPILEGDNLDKVVKRLARNERNIKDSKKVQLWRYEDPILGPRKFPNLETPHEGKIQLSNGCQFKIDITAQKVFVELWIWLRACVLLK